MLKPQIDREVYFQGSYFTADRFTNFGNQLAEITKLKPKKVLEIGIGNGLISTVLRQAGVEVVTCDFDASLNPDVVASATDLPIADGSFDLVVCCEVLEHLPFENFAVAMAEIQRVSSDSVVFSVPDCRAFMRLEIFRPNYSRRRYGFNLPFKIPAHKHFCDEHYWEIGEKDYPLTRILNIMTEVGFVPVRTYRLWQKPNQRFFILKAPCPQTNNTELSMDFELADDFESGLVSVIIPVYNRSELLLETLESVRKQDYHSIEVIVVDDGSTENIKEVIAKFADEFKNEIKLRYLHQSNQGAEAARNLGLCESKGEFIQFLDSDDLLKPKKISSQVKALSDRSEAEFAFCAWEYMDWKDDATRKGWLKSFDSSNSSLIDYTLRCDMRQVIPICAENALYRRAFCKTLGPRDPFMTHMHETLYNLKALLLDAPFVYSPETNVRVRIHSGERITPQANEYEDLTNRQLGWRRVRKMIADSGKLNHTRRKLVAKQFYDMARCAFQNDCDFLGHDLLNDALCTVTELSVARLKIIAVKMLYNCFGVESANRFFDIGRKILR